MEPTHHFYDSKVSSECNISKKLSLFFLWHHNLYNEMEKEEKEFYSENVIPLARRQSRILDLNHRPFYI